MKSTLQEILEVEKKAQERTKEALLYKQNTIDEIADIRKKLAEEKLQQAEIKIDELKKKSEADTEKRLSSSKKNCEETIESLDLKSKNSSDEWVSAIVKRVLAGE